MRRAPLPPASRRLHVVSTPQPSGVTMPSPVTTTRLMPVPCPSLVAPARLKQTGGAIENTERLHLSSEARKRYRASPTPTSRGESWARAVRAEHLGVVRTRSALCVLFQKFDRIADGQDRLRGVIGN